MKKISHRNRGWLLECLFLALTILFSGACRVQPSIGRPDPPPSAEAPIAVRCTPFQWKGQLFMEFTVKNVCREKVYLVTTYSAPYIRVELDGTISIFTGVLPKIRTYYGSSTLIAPVETRRLGRGRSVGYDVLLVPFEEKDWWDLPPLAEPPHGKKTVVCKAAWRSTPLPDDWGKHTNEYLYSLQSFVSSEPVEVILP